MLKEKIETFSNIINTSLESYIIEEKIEQENLIKAMRYSLLAPGKRIRPILMMTTTEMFGGNPMKAIPYACAIEMIHNFTLIHDDLPAIDNDDYRRGMPTNHKVFGESTAILAGDALLNRAYEIMIEDLLDNKDIDVKIRAMETISYASGCYGVIGGELVDIECENKNVSKETIKYMYKKKTAEIIIASIKTGAIIARAKPEEIKAVEEYALNIGLAFQIKDDILGEIGDEKRLGKKIGRDKEMKKSTYYNLEGLEESTKLLEETTRKAIESLKPLGKKADILIEFANYLLKREK